MTRFLDSLNRFVWGVPALLLILAVGLLVSFRTKMGAVSSVSGSCPQLFKAEPSTIRWNLSLQSFVYGIGGNGRNR